MDGDQLLWNAMMLIPLVLSLSLHEWAHAYTAWLLGDDTAASQGRLTVNPVVHIDPLGTLLLPLLGVPFGWAKPVPVNPVRFTRAVSMDTGMAITAAAGPLANVALALGCAVTYGLLWRFAPEVLFGNRGLNFLLQTAMTMNVGLAIFNMLPVPPLDGSRVLQRFIPTRFQRHWESFNRAGPIAMLVLIVLGAHFLRGPIGAVSGVLSGLVEAIASA